MLLNKVYLPLNRFHLNFIKHICPSSWEFRYWEETQNLLHDPAKDTNKREAALKGPNLLWMDEWKWQRWSGLISIQGEHGSEIERETQRPVISLHIEITALFRVKKKKSSDFQKRKGQQCALDKVTIFWVAAENSHRISVFMPTGKYTIYLVIKHRWTFFSFSAPMVHYKNV